jgi:type IV secretion system protein VirB8
MDLAANGIAMKYPKTSTTAVEQAAAKCADFEVTLADMARRSERRAWGVAWGAIAMSLLLGGGYYYMLPLKEKVPFLVMADAYTGTSTIARLEDGSTHRQLTSSEAINRSNVAHFLLARESYDIDMMQLRDWRLVHTMSSPEVAAGYAAEHANNNPQAPYHVYGRGRAIRSRILSLVLVGGGKGAVPKGATVRFQRSLYDKATGTSRPLDSKIATLEFEYKSNLKMDEKERIENPLGFQVTSYRVDNDYAPAPSIDGLGPPLTGNTAGEHPRAGAGLAAETDAGMLAENAATLAAPMAAEGIE